MTFATFHSDLSAGTLAKVRRHEAENGTASFDWGGADCGRTARAMIEMMFATVSLTHPGCRKIIVTDERASFEAAEGVEVFRCALGDDPVPSLSRSIAWVEFLRQAAPDSHVIFLDYDMLVLQSLEPVFVQLFDVGLTYRGDHERWPINAGIQFIHAARLKQARYLYEKALAIFQERYLDWGVWCGDQWAFREMIQAEYRQKGPFLHREGGREVLLLPCDPYNYSPVEAWEQGDDPLADKKVLHFKGPFKAAMYDYWMQHLASLCPAVDVSAFRGWLPESAGDA